MVIKQLSLVVCLGVASTQAAMASFAHDRDFNNGYKVSSSYRTTYSQGTTYKPRTPEYLLQSAQRQAYYKKHGYYNATQAIRQKQPQKSKQTRHKGPAGMILVQEAEKTPDTEVSFTRTFTHAAPPEEGNNNNLMAQVLAEYQAAAQEDQLQGDDLNNTNN